MSDKRAVSTDALETLGMIHFREEHRDAIHLAVLPAEAGEYLNPGTPIIIDVEGKAVKPIPHSFDGPGEYATGIVDPFLPRAVSPGEKFWFIVNPRTITSLRHVWSHPAFPEEITITRGTGDVDAEEVVNEVPEPLSPVLVPPELPAIIQPAEPEILISNDAKKNAAYNWICNYADELSGENDDNYYTITADELIGYAQSHLDSTSRWGGDYLVKGGLLEGECTSDEFWQHLAVYLGIEIPENYSQNFFSCSC